MRASDTSNTLITQQEAKQSHDTWRHLARNGSTAGARADLVRLHGRVGGALLRGAPLQHHRRHTGGVGHDARRLQGGRHRAQRAPGVRGVGPRPTARGAREAHLAQKHRATATSAPTVTPLIARVWRACCKGSRIRSANRSGQRGCLTSRWANATRKKHAKTIHLTYIRVH